jgi:hypothetical protein
MSIESLADRSARMSDCTEARSKNPTETDCSVEEVGLDPAIPPDVPLQAWYNLQYKPQEIRWKIEGTRLPSRRVPIAGRFKSSKFRGVSQQKGRRLAWREGNLRVRLCGTLSVHDKYYYNSISSNTKKVLEVQLIRI